MKKTIFIFFIVLSMFATGQPIQTLRVATNATAVGENLSVGAQVYSVYESELYVTIEAVESTESIETASTKFQLIVNYNRLRDEYLSLFQGVVWNSSLNTYQRMGSVINISTGVSAGNANLPIQSEIKRCLLADEGIVNYYIDADNPHLKDGTTASITGTATSTSANELIDSVADFIVNGVADGMVVKNTTDNTYSIVTDVTATVLTIAPDYFVSTDTYEVGTANYGGSDGQVMAEIPKFYMRADYDTDSRYWAISRYQLPGFTLHSAFWKDGQEVDYRYYSAFEGSMYDDSNAAMTAKASITTGMYAVNDKFCSVAGQWAKTNETQEEYLAGAVSRGNGWRNIDFTLNSAIQLLYLVEYASFNTQGMIGAGRTGLSGVWEADSYIGMTGLSIGDGNASGNVSNGGTAGQLTDYMSYRGIENWYGNVWKMLSGITWDGRWTGTTAAQPVYYTNNIDYFKPYGSENMKFLTNAPYIGSAAGYIADYENTSFFIPSGVGSSSLVYDYYYQYSESSRNYWRVVRFGGHAYAGSVAGGFALYAFDVWSHVAVAVAGRLAY
jgi:hypothetical protein